MGGFRDDFDGALDTAVWIPHYLPQWSSRAASAATYETGGSELHLTIPAAQGIWCEGDHEPPLRVSGCVFEVFGDGVEPGRSAAVGMGVHPFRDPALTDDFAAPRLDLDVREPHTYTAAWQPGRVDFAVDGTHVAALHVDRVAGPA